MDTLSQEMVKRMVPVFEKAPVTKAYLFGSMARGEADEASDVDVLIEAPVQGFSLFDQGGMLTELANVCGRKVDLVTTDSVSHHIREYVDHDKVLIYERRL